MNVLRERSERIKPIAGGTDAVIQLREGALQTKELLDISRLGELRYILKEGSRVRIGALSTHSGIIESSILNLAYRVLVEPSRIIGVIQLQNRVTIGGNLANPH